MVKISGVIMMLLFSSLVLAQAFQTQPSAIPVRPPTKDWLIEMPMGAEPYLTPQVLEQVQKNTALGSAQFNLGIAQTSAIKELAEKVEKLEARVRELEAARSKK